MLKKPFAFAVIAAVLSLAPELRAATVFMPDVIREFEADARSVDSFYDLPWSEPMLDRQQKLGCPCSSSCARSSDCI